MALETNIVNHGSCALYSDVVSNAAKSSVTVNMLLPFKWCILASFTYSHLRWAGQVRGYGDKRSVQRSWRKKILLKPSVRQRLYFWSGLLKWCRNCKERSCDCKYGSVIGRPVQVGWQQIPRGHGASSYYFSQCWCWSGLHISRR